MEKETKDMASDSGSRRGKRKIKGWKGVTIGGYQRVKRTEQDLLKAVAQGPISAGVIFDQSIKDLGKGIWDGKAAVPIEGKYSYHAMVLTGYGTNPDDDKIFFRFKSSWGTKWGDEGYGKILRDSSSEDCEVPLIKNAMFATDIVRVYDGN
ncbi:hypothetical protein CRG98_034831 [Punica granatum]|uniref:Peptidase C1A papain C-terminal domain-containing protein n=1 Tax=Punica granatum TaxID=22663 RepID=A0A2I0IMD1_PUNGR|nr:hypothetical protein CRG98_034831 [Punica granatum]